MIGATITFLELSKTIHRDFSVRQSALDWIHSVTGKSENVVGGLDDGSYAVWVGEGEKENL